MYATAKIIVKGVVQGVGFRYFTVIEARKLSINGYTRNRQDGSVEVLAEGKKSDILTLVKNLRIGPSLSHVTDIEIEWQDYESRYKGFLVTY